MQNTEFQVSAGERKKMGSKVPKFFELDQYLLELNALQNNLRRKLRCLPTENKSKVTSDFHAFVFQLWEPPLLTGRYLPYLLD